MTRERCADAGSRQGGTHRRRGRRDGGAIARRFAREGFAVCATRWTAAKLQAFVEQIHAEGGTAHGFASDARVEAEVTGLFERI